MTKYPLLEQLRAERERVEAEIAEPIQSEARARVAWFQSRAVELERALEALIGRDISKHVAAALGDMLAQEVEKAIREALPKKKEGEDFLTLILPIEVFRMLGDQRSVHHEVLRRYQQTLPVELRAVSQFDLKGKAEVTFLRATLPEVHAQIVVSP